MSERRFRRFLSPERKRYLIEWHYYDRGFDSRGRRCLSLTVYREAEDICGRRCWEPVESSEGRTHVLERIVAERWSSRRPPRQGAK